MNAVDKVTGEKIPLRTFAVSILSKTSVVDTRSALMRAMAKSRSSGVSQQAVLGWSVRVK